MRAGSLFSLGIYIRHKDLHNIYAPTILIQVKTAWWLKSSAELVLWSRVWLQKSLNHTVSVLSHARFINNYHVISAILTWNWWELWHAHRHRRSARTKLITSLPQKSEGKPRHGFEPQTTSTNPQGSATSDQLWEVKSVQQAPPLLVLPPPALILDLNGEDSQREGFFYCTSIQILHSQNKDIQPTAIPWTGLRDTHTWGPHMDSSDVYTPANPHIGSPHGLQWCLHPSY